MSKAVGAFVGAVLLFGADADARLAEQAEPTIVCAGPSKYHRCNCPMITTDNADQFKRISLEEAARQQLAPHDACSPPVIPDELRPVTPEVFKACVTEKISQWGRVKIDGLLAAPSGSDHPVLRFDMHGAATTGTRAGSVPFKRGEIVTFRAISPNLIVVASALKHSITRGQGAFQHQSPENLNLLLAFELGTRATFDCSAVAKAWGNSFEDVPEDSFQKAIAGSPSGVLVDEVAAGMSPAEVEGILGPPDRRATLAGKTVYFYPRMKVTFVAGKVTDVE